MGFPVDCWRHLDADYAPRRYDPHPRGLRPGDAVASRCASGHADDRRAANSWRRDDGAGDDQGLAGRVSFVGAVDRAVALSAIITPVVRGAFPVAPMHSAKAPVAGSGKSDLFDVAAAVAIGQIMPVMAAGSSEEELKKRLGAA